ncbi:Fic family protein [Pajaroellobacter abortibovis]|uniref:Fic family protein n=1 Tax=Pajaroellobacter abortibovis TaxID=1882918 RepID=UPI001FE779DC|nr:Fic family protein [Pajaroellobacter abortibovis]
MCRHWFKTIHPFLDGNGHVGHLLIMLLLVEQKMLSLLLLYLSAFFEAARDEYYKQLYNLSGDGSGTNGLVFLMGLLFKPRRLYRELNASMNY